MKKDLNLIPRAESQSSLNKYILPVVLIALLYAATAYLAITIPQQRLQAREDSYAVLEQKVADIAYVEAEYQELREKLAEIEAKKQTISLTMHSEKEAINILFLIEQACPEDVFLTEIVNTPEGIIIVGNSNEDSLVAQFMVNLRAIELFSVSNIVRIEPAASNSIDMLSFSSDGQELPYIRKFRLTLAYVVEEPAEDANGGEG